MEIPGTPIAKTNKDVDSVIKKIKNLDRTSALQELKRTEKLIKSHVPMCLWKGTSSVQRKVRTLNVDPATRNKIARLNWKLSLVLCRRELKKLVQDQG